MKEVNIFGKVILYPEKVITQNICERLVKNTSHCKSHIRLGVALCMSLGNTMSWCHGVTTVQALCLKAGHPKRYCRDLTFSEALCLDLGHTRNYCQSISEEKVLKLLKEDKLKQKNKL